ncbi:hypothetical protein [Marinobacter sp.]|uniref:hypothetical protein n=1 Tax=Marinobacter sp. TaxID=50741 RepID=UPI000C8CB37A|nr:hypothetical protein [Marinobacter sp.]MAB51196.1 hypothetical protein [Marinobacter sp.]|tara:strand:- start:518 stop:745 length:228 start_codon:yes stop_codon:yes gene_type:complete
MQDLKVETIKKGDVLFFLDQEIELLERILKTDETEEVKWKSNDNKTLEEWYNGRLDARKFDLNSFKELRKIINKL